jgi:hypothetical protein
VNLIHNVYFHGWHWLFQQIQLDVWFGNIVAGVVGWLAARGRYKKFHSKLAEPLHAKLDTAHELMRHIIRYHPDIPDFPQGDK